MPREYRYRGYTLEQLNGMPTEALLQLLPSRARRSLNRGVSEEKRKLIEDARRTKDGKIQGQIKTHARDMVVLPLMVGLTIHVHNGRENDYIPRDRKSTRLNSSHGSISYAVFCLKKKKNTRTEQIHT